MPSHFCLFPIRHLLFIYVFVRRMLRRNAPYRQFLRRMRSPQPFWFVGQLSHVVAWNKKGKSLILCKFTFWGIHRTKSLCKFFVAVSFLLNMTLNLFLLINKIICMGKVDSLFLPEKSLRKWVTKVSVAPLVVVIEQVLTRRHCKQV